MSKCRNTSQLWFWNNSHFLQIFRWILVCFSSYSLISKWDPQLQLKWFLGAHLLVVAKNFFVQCKTRNKTMFALCNQHKHSLSQIPIPSGLRAKAITKKRIIGARNPRTSCGWNLYKPFKKHSEITTSILCIYKDAEQLTVSIAKKACITECCMSYNIKATWTLKRKGARLCSGLVIAGSSSSIPLNRWHLAHLCCLYSVVDGVIEFTI